MDLETAPLVIALSVEGSGPRYWQGLRQVDLPTAVRIARRSWDKPEREDWVGALDRTLEEADERVLMVASSDDPHADLTTSRARAQACSPPLVEVDAPERINDRSDLGAWPPGLDLLRAFAARPGPGPPPSR